MQEDQLRAARNVARERNVSLDELIHDFLQQLVSEHHRRNLAGKRLEQIWRTTHVDVGPNTRTGVDLHKRGR